MVLKRVTCFYKVFGMKDAGPGLKSSGIGNCLLCKDDPEENKKCKAYFEVNIEEEFFGYEEK